MQDLTGKITGSTLTAAEWNQLPQEVQNVIVALGITLGSGDLNQLGKAIAGYVANGTFYTDSGAADAYVLSVIGNKQAATAYTDGFEINFVTTNPNTGASTVNVAGLGVKSIKLEGGGDPSAGQIDGRVKCVFDSGNDWFELQVSAAGTSLVAENRSAATQSVPDATPVTFAPLNTNFTADGSDYLIDVKLNLMITVAIASDVPLVVKLLDGATTLDVQAYNGTTSAVESSNMQLKYNGSLTGSVALTVTVELGNATGTAVINADVSGGSNTSGQESVLSVLKVGG